MLATEWEEARVVTDEYVNRPPLNLDLTVGEDSPFHWSQGPMYQAVAADIAQLNPEVLKKRQTYKQAAIVLAIQIDSYAGHTTTAADRSAFARVVSELRTVMDRLTGVASDSDGDEGKRLSTPHWASAEVSPAVRDEEKS